MPSYIEICSVVSDKKIFKVFSILIYRENKKIFFQVFYIDI